MEEAVLLILVFTIAQLLRRFVPVLPVQSFLRLLQTVGRKFPLPVAPQGFDHWEIPGFCSDDRPEIQQLGSEKVDPLISGLQPLSCRQA